MCKQTLARAIYARKELVILDDVLSGLDAVTEEEIFQAVLGPQGILRQQSTTVVLATNAGMFPNIKQAGSSLTSAVHRLSEADYIIALDNNGEIDEKGTFDRLKSTDGYTNSLAVTRRKSTDAPKDRDNRLAYLLEGMLPPSATEAEEDTKQNHAGDFTIYKYYIQTFGWVNWFLFMFFCAIYGFSVAFPSKMPEDCTGSFRVLH